MSFPTRSPLIKVLKKKSVKAPLHRLKLPDVSKLEVKTKPKVNPWGANIFIDPPVSLRNKRNINVLPPNSNYQAKPVLTPIGTALFGDYLGVEMEFECADGNEDCRDELVYESNQLINNSGDDFCIFKHDGSLKGSGEEGKGGHYGFEMCSRPASLEEHKKRWQAFFKKLPAGLAVSARCGMHVHVSKAPMTPLQIGKIIAFVHNPDNKIFIEKVAGRASNNYADYSDGDKTFKHALRKHLGTFKHYSAVNILNGATVELRIFAGTLSFARFAANIEFVHALAKFTVPGVVSVSDGKNRTAFMNFLNKNRKVYPYLVAFLATNGYSKTMRNIKNETSIREAR